MYEICLGAHRHWSELPWTKLKPNRNRSLFYCMVEVFLCKVERVDQCMHATYKRLGHESLLPIRLRKKKYFLEKY